MSRVKNKIPSGFLPVWEENHRSNTKDGKEWKDIDKLEDKKDRVPSSDSKEKTWKRKSPVQLKKGEKSGWNALEDEFLFVPPKEKDTDVLQLDPLYKEIKEALEDISESTTPDAGGGSLLRSLWTGAAMEPGNTYKKNFCADPPADEEMNSPANQDVGGTIIAPKHWVPSE